MEQSPTCDIGAWVPPPGSPAEHVYEVMFRHRCRAWLGISAACGLAGAAIYVILFAASAKWLTRFLVVVSLVATATVSVLAFLFQPSYIGFALAAAAGLSIIMLILTACVYSGIEDLFTIAGASWSRRGRAQWGRRGWRSAHSLTALNNGSLVSEPVTLHRLR